MAFQMFRIGSGLFVAIVFLINGVKSVLTNVGINKTVTASSDAPGWWGWGNIVDGDIRRNAYACACCGSTKQETDPWVTVDLGHEYWIDNVVVYGRSDTKYAYRPQNFRDLQINVTDHSGLQAYLINTVAGDDWIDFVKVPVGKKSRYVTLLLKGGARRLVVCELEVYGSACAPGSFGEDCNSMCGKCYDNAPCDTVTGACDQCLSGFEGVTCSTACENGTYGSNCRLACGHCYRDQPCNKVDGTCSRCDLGYLADLCETECISGFYGQDCSTLCGFCLKNETCNHVTGLCSKGCAAGHQGDTCKQECGNFTFGVNCRQQCHCVDGKSCDSNNGDCEDGLCEEGFFGVDCQQMNGGLDESDGNNQGMIIGVVSGVACIIIVFVVAGACFLKRRKRGAKSSETVTTSTDEHHYEDLYINLSHL